MNSGCQEGFSVNNLFPTLLSSLIRTENIYRNFSFLLFFVMLTTIASNYQKQSRIGVLWKRSSSKFRKIYRKIPLPEARNFIKKRVSDKVFFCEFCEISKKTSPVTASRLFVSSFYSYGELWLLTVEILFLFWIEL